MRVLMLGLQAGISEPYVRRYDDDQQHSIKTDGGNTPLLNQTHGWMDPTLFRPLRERKCSISSML